MKLAYCSIHKFEDLLHRKFENLRKLRDINDSQYIAKIWIQNFNLHISSNNARCHVNGNTHLLCSKIQGIIFFYCNGNWFSCQQHAPFSSPTEHPGLTYLVQEDVQSFDLLVQAALIINTLQFFLTIIPRGLNPIYQIHSFVSSPR